MKKEDFSLVLGDIRDDFVARAHEPVRPRRAAPNRRRWCAAACLCLVTATAVLLTARYLPLKDYKDGDTNYSPASPSQTTKSASKPATRPRTPASISALWRSTPPESSTRAGM